MAHRPRRTRQRSVEPAVRRLLADARHTEPLPPEVAARLDRVLADLGAQRADQQADDHRQAADDRQAAPVADLADRGDLAARRRRRATALLAAAAAVVAVGVGVDRLATSSPSSSTSEATADRDRSAGGTASGNAPGSDAPSGSTPQGLTGDSRAKTLERVARVRPDHFSDDAARAVRLVAGTRGVRDAPEAQAGSAARSTFRCVRGDWGPGRLVGVHYRRTPAVLVVRPAQGEVRVVDLFRCGGSAPVRSTTLPIR